jgi:divalent metal cation (Fe/Co/Zn/Cd) transporter
VAHDQDGGQDPAPEVAGETDRHGDELSVSAFGPITSEEVETLTTVLVAFVANALIAVAKTVAALITGSASLVAEAAHSWADTGNEIFLVVANRRSRRPPDGAHPFGPGREAYVWSLFAALGPFVAGAAVSVTHGVQELVHPQPASDFVVG